MRRQGRGDSGLACISPQASQVWFLEGGNSVNKFSLKVKLGFGFGSLLMLVVLMGYLSYSSANGVARVTRQVDDAVAMKDASMDISQGVWKGLASTRAFLLSGNQSYLHDYQEGNHEVEVGFDRLSKMELDDAETKMNLAIKKSVDGLRDKQDKAIELRKNGDERQAVQTLFGTEALEIHEGLRAALRQFDEKQDQDLQDSSNNQRAQGTRSEWMALSVAGVGVVLGLVLAILLAGSITGAISKMVAMIQTIAANNLTVADMEITTRDAIGEAGIALNQMKNNLHGVIESISGTAVQVAGASEELSSTSQQITANSEETSAQAKVVSEATAQVSQNLQTVATGAEEMGASIKEIAKNATEAAKIAASAVKVAETTTATVSKLGESSTEIGLVIKVITSIAQ